MERGEDRAAERPPAVADQDEPIGVALAEKAVVTGIGTGILFAGVLASIALLLSQGQVGRVWLTLPFVFSGLLTVYLLRTRRIELGVRVDRMNLIVEGLLRLARVSRGKLEVATVDMNDVLRRLLEDIRPNYPEARIVVDDLPEAEGDPTLIQQVLANLVGNALKYSSHEEHPEVHVGWSEPDRAWFVRDNGVGFDMSQATRLFENFTRLHGADEFEGTGIGLSLVKKIVERHGGRIWAQSEPGEGAEFYFRLDRGATT